jgi:hypothetical protein
VIHLTIAYCILAHKNPSQVKRLLKSIHSKNDIFYVNVFGKNNSQAEWKNQISQVDSDVCINFKFGKSWGLFPVVQATIDAMRHFSAFNYDYMVNLTGQCYPLKSVAKIKKALSGKNSAFLDAHRIPYAVYGGSCGFDRIRYSYYRNPVMDLRDWVRNTAYRCKRYESRYLLRLTKFHKNLPYGLKPYTGSAYFCITKKHVNYILDYICNRPKLMSFYKHSFAPDEMVFNTILANSNFKNDIVVDNLRYIDWSKPGEYRLSPAVLTSDDADKLLKSPALFARKFDAAKDSEIMDLIDKHRST